MRRSATLVIAALVVVGGCSSDDDDSSDTTAAISATTTGATTTTDATTTTARATTTTAGATTTTSRATTTSGGATTTTARGTSTTDATDATEGTGSTESTEGETTDGTTLEDRFAVIEEALQEGNFTVMLQALNLSGVADEINERDVTILAPTDEAFQGLGIEGIAQLLQDPSRVRDVLSRHLLDEVYTFDELSARTEVTTVSGDTLAVTFEGGVLEIDGAVVTEVASDRLDGEDAPVAAFSIDEVLLEDD